VSELPNGTSERTNILFLLSWLVFGKVGARKPLGVPIRPLFSKSFPTVRTTGTATLVSARQLFHLAASSRNPLPLTMRSALIPDENRTLERAIVDTCDGSLHCERGARRETTPLLRVAQST